MVPANPNWTPKQVCENWFQTVWNEKNREAIRELFAGHAAGLDPADQKHRMDPAEYEKLWDEFQAALENITATVVDVIEDGNRGAVRFHFEGTHKATGKRVTFEGAGFVEVKDGRIVDAWNAVDFLGMAIQAQALPVNVLSSVLSGSKLAV